MEELKPIRSALISVYNKDRIELVARQLFNLGIEIYSTGGTYEFISALGIPAKTVESLTNYPSILGGRVKTLHPKVFGGILYRRNHEADLHQVTEYEIPPIDLVIVDLYPFELTVSSGSTHEEIIEKIDIGGISLIRAAAKSYQDVLIVASSTEYDDLVQLLDDKKGFTSLVDRHYFAAQAFNISSHYDTAIFNYLNRDTGIKAFKQSILVSESMRYGENPHQEGTFYGNLGNMFEQLNGKAISFNNVVDLDAAIALIAEFREPAFTIIKHTNACGVAIRNSLIDAWKDALAGDPVSAFGGVIASNQEIDTETAEEINKLFFEIILAPGYEKNALELLKSKKNRIILRHKPVGFQAKQFKSVLNGVIEQGRDNNTEGPADLNVVTHTLPDDRQVRDLIFANIVVKHLKSNAIVLAKNGQLLGSGCGMTSRVDAVKHAISKAAEFGLNLEGSVMASDAFFPFTDSIDAAYNAGIRAVIQPGGSVRDEDSIRFCDEHNIAMVFTGTRHFKH